MTKYEAWVRIGMQGLPVFLDALRVFWNELHDWNLVHQKITECFPMFRRSQRTLRRWYYKYPNPASPPVPEKRGRQIDLNLVKQIEETIKATPSISQQTLAKRSVATYTHMCISLVELGNEFLMSFLKKRKGNGYYLLRLCWQS